MGRGGGHYSLYLAWLGSTTRHNTNIADILLQNTRVPGHVPHVCQQQSLCSHLTHRRHCYTEQLIIAAQQTLQQRAGTLEAEDRTQS